MGVSGTFMVSPGSPLGFGNPGGHDTRGASQAAWHIVMDWVCPREAVEFVRYAWDRPLDFQGGLAGHERDARAYIHLTPAGRVVPARCAPIAVGNGTSRPCANQSAVGLRPRWRHRSSPVCRPLRPEAGPGNFVPW